MTAKRSKTDLTQERLKELLHYDPETGVFTWKVSRSGLKNSVGRTAGGQKQDGYHRIVIDRLECLAHRLAFLYMTGSWPDHQVDHIDGDRSNNRWANLRDVVASMNIQNIRNRRSKSGLRGVQKSSNGRYSANICLGTYDTPEEAHDMYLRAKQLFHPGFVPPNANNGLGIA